MKNGYAMTWVWAVILAPVAAALFYAGWPVMTAVLLAFALFVLIGIARRRRAVTARPPARPLTRRDRYEAYIHSSAWRRKRAERLALDRGRCAKCGSTRNLQCHHRSYANFGNEPMSDLITWCERCHRDHHASHRKAALGR